VSVGGIATITRWPSAVTASETTVTPLPVCEIDRTGAFRTIRLPSWAATRSGTWNAPLVKRRCCAPPVVLKFRSKVPGCVSSPDAAM
jgi:hypothetical protein